MHKKHWWKVMLLILAASATGLIAIGVGTYRQAPPIADFRDESGGMIVSRESILRGQRIFHERSLMHYGTMFGDGAMRGPDFTAAALHAWAVGMIDRTAGAEASETERETIAVQVRRALKENRYDSATNVVTLSQEQAAGTGDVRRHFASIFLGSGIGAFRPAAYFTSEQDVDDLSACFLWGAWVCAAERPGSDCSYTNNWPFDPLAGNTPTADVMIWSVVGSLALFVVLGLVLYLYGRLDTAAAAAPGPRGEGATADQVIRFEPSPMQRATYKFFAVAAVLFLLQVTAGILTVHDFVGFTRFFGVDISQWLPITIVRAWHTQLSVLWIMACWIAASLFILPVIAPAQPPRQLAWVNVLFWMLVVLVGGSFVGIFLGPHGLAGAWWRWVGTQGWEFMEMGRLWQWTLYAAFVVWGYILVRGVRTVLAGRDPWSLPHWLVYTVTGVILLFASSFVAGEDENFTIADFWRWMVVHMWVEAFFELLTTILVAYFLRIMGFVTEQVATRVVYIAAILFLGSGLLGISHNFYWNAKSIETIALGAVFSSLQVVPLILLTVEAWKFRQIPKRHGRMNGRPYVLGEAFLFLVGVNFWNFMGAGVFGFIINLPAVNYYEHGTYLTVNHGHAALMGVYGNLSIAAMLFVGRFLIPDGRWNGRLLQISFWSLNVGLSLMVLLDLFPAGIHQLADAMKHGLWHARSPEFLQSDFFQTLTWLRIVGGSLFVVGGVVPLVWFMVSRWTSIKPSFLGRPDDDAAASQGMPFF